MELERLKRTRYKKDLIKSFAVCLIFLISGECLFWGLDASGIIGVPYDWGSRNLVAFKINECRRLFNQNPNKFKIIGIGDSMMEMGLNPILLDSLFDGNTITYNLGLAGVAVRFESLYLQKVIFQEIKPDFVIWEVNNVDFWDWVPANEQDNLLLESPAGIYYSGNMSGLNFDESINQFLMKYSYLYRYHSYFIPPFYESSANNLYLDYQRGFLNTTGSSISTGETTISDEPGIISESAGYPITFSEQAKTLFYEVLSQITNAGIGFLIIYGPFMHKHIVFPALDNIFASLSESDFLDFNGNESLMADELYYNDLHLNSQGSSIYTNFTFEKIKNRILPILEET